MIRPINPDESVTINGVPITAWQLAEARQELSHRGVHNPRWAELSQRDQGTAALSAGGWLRALADLLPTYCFGGTCGRAALGSHPPHPLVPLADENHWNDVECGQRPNCTVPAHHSIDGDEDEAVAATPNVSEASAIGEFGSGYFEIGDTAPSPARCVASKHIPTTGAACSVCGAPGMQHEDDHPGGAR